MQKQITETFERVRAFVDMGPERINLLIYFVIGGEKQPALDGFTGEPNKVEAVEYAGHWLEDIGRELCGASEGALQYSKPSRELLSLLDKTLPMGTSMLSLAKELQRCVEAANKTTGEIDFDIEDMNRIWIQFEHLRVVLLQAGLKVTTRMTNKP